MDRAEAASHTYLKWENESSMSTRTARFTAPLEVLAWREGIAAGDGKLLLNTAISSISSSLHSTDKLVEMIDPSQCEDDHEVSINGGHFSVEDGELV